MSWLRALPVRVVFGIAILLAIIGMHMAVAKPRLPFVLIESFDKAWSLAHEALEAEAAKPRKGPTLDEVLAHLDHELSVACDAATDLLDGQLASLASLAPERRAAALDCTLRHLVAAREHLVHANDPEEYAEYDALCERLRDVRRLLS
jgi:hypothetical protein